MSPELARELRDGIELAKRHLADIRATLGYGGHVDRLVRIQRHELHFLTRRGRTAYDRTRGAS